MWPHHSMATGVPVEMALVSTSPIFLLLACLRGGLKTPDWRSMSSHPACSDRQYEWGRGQAAITAIWKYLPRVDPALMFFWHPSDSKPCTELILWGDKIMRIVLPKIMKYHMSAFYHWFECILRKLNVTKTQDIFGNCMLSSNFVWIFIQALFYELYKML